MNEQRMVNVADLRIAVEMLEEDLPYTNIALAPKELPVVQLIDKLKAIISGPGVEPVAWSDRRAQIVYDILCSDATPTDGQHWEGFIARCIVGALDKLAAPSAPQCVHEWRDWNPSGVNNGRAVVWCHKCDALAFAGSEHQTAPSDPVQAVPDWQPIETAPKDGRLIFVGHEKGVWAARYNDIFSSGYKPTNPWRSMLLNHDHIRHNHSLTPTHWMPLPQPPKEIVE